MTHQQTLGTVNLPTPAHAFLNHATEANTSLVSLCLSSLPPDTAYTSRDLYAFYVAVCSERNIPPLTANIFGRVLTKLGAIAGRDSTGTRRVWRTPAA